MVNLFLQGQRKEFFRRWIENISDDLTNNDLSAQKLELELNIHFAIFPFRKSVKEVYQFFKIKIKHLFKII